MNKCANFSYNKILRYIHSKIWFNDQCTSR